MVGFISKKWSTPVMKSNGHLKTGQICPCIECLTKAGDKNGSALGWPVQYEINQSKTILVQFLDFLL
jgi:hypothetical protein